MLLPVCDSNSYLTLHYRLVTQAGCDIVNTFHGTPATLQLGSGQLAPFLEQCLYGLTEGTRKTFALLPENAFGNRHDDLVQWLSVSALERPSSEKPLAVGDEIQFKMPNGNIITGRAQVLQEDSVLLDFNHPLAGQALLFETEIIGIL